MAKRVQLKWRNSEFGSKDGAQRSTLRAWLWVEHSGNLQAKLEIEVVAVNVKKPWNRETFNSKVWTISFVWIWMVQGRSLVATFRPVWRVCFSVESSIINQLLRQQIAVFGFREDLAFGFTGQTIYVSGVVPWQHLEHCKRFACFRPYTYVYMYSCAVYIYIYIAVFATGLHVQCRDNENLRCSSGSHLRICGRMHLGRDLETLHLDLVYDIWPQVGWGYCFEIRRICLTSDCWTVVATVKQGEARQWNTVKEHHSREHVHQGPSTALLYLALSSSECATVPWALICFFICRWCSNSLNSCLYIPSCRMFAPKATSAQVFDSGATNNAAALILGGWINISGCTL